MDHIGQAQPMNRSVSIRLGQFAREALAGEEGSGEPIASRVEAAVRCYLNDKGSDLPGWPYPHFLPVEEPKEGTELQLSVDEVLWRSLVEEAESQGVSAQQLVEHAVLYFAAEVNAGRATRRIILNDGD
jgi:hypothetical protein